MLRPRQLDLWGILGGKRAKPAPPPSIKRPVARRPAPPTRAGRRPTGAMRDRYELVTRELLRIYGVRVRKWRTSMSGVAWQVTYRDGTVSNLIEAPKPRGPMSAAIFCHEIGHHAIGFRTYRPRCLEEYHAWAWSLRTMAQYELNVTQNVRNRMHDSLCYAIQKARRRGLKQIPAELEPFCRPRPLRSPN